MKLEELFKEPYLTKLQQLRIDSPEKLASRCIGRENCENKDSFILEADNIRKYLDINSMDFIDIMVELREISKKLNYNNVGYGALKK